MLLYSFYFLKVTDIADAMILRNLISSFIESGMTIVTTSNRHPDGKSRMKRIFLLQLFEFRAVLEWDPEG